VPVLNNASIKMRKIAV